MSQIIVALDFPSRQQAMELVARLEPQLCRLKVGHEMFTAYGPEFVKQLIGQGFDVFLDLKFFDIPNTVYGACREVADMGVWMTNVHASGGPKMMTAAKKAIDDAGAGTILIAVTVLTSFSQEEMGSLSDMSLIKTVEKLTSLTVNAGLDGVVCSAADIPHVKKSCRFPDQFSFVTPGVRPVWASSDDQCRILTPAQAVEHGASHLVIGRPITTAEDPVAALNKIRQELE